MYVREFRSYELRGLTDILGSGVCPNGPGFALSGIRAYDAVAGSLVEPKGVRPAKFRHQTLRTDA